MAVFRTQSLPLQERLARLQEELRMSMNQVPAPAPDLEREVIHLREQVAQLQEDRTIQPVVKKQAIGRPVSSRRDGHGRIPLMPRLVPNDVTI